MPNIFGKVLMGVAVAGIGLQSADAQAAETKVPVTISGGHEIAKNDFGRPVALIAAGLGVEPEVFRKAFSGVAPARGRGPTGDEARRNKAALLQVLAPHGVTNERLDEVSDYYRFQPQRGELWPTKAARGYAIVENGAIKKIVVSDPGSGYCSSPNIQVDGFEKVEFRTKLGFSKDLKKNGAISSIEVARAR